MATEFALCKEDQEKFGGPKWVAFDRAVLDELPFDQLDPWEKQIIEHGNISLTVLIYREFANGTQLGIKGVAWLARQMAGITEPSFADFNIKSRKVELRVVKPKGDAVPPPAGSSATSSAGEPSAQE